jgi:prephenate dehydrogenase
LRTTLAAADGRGLETVFANAQRARREWIEAIEAGSPPPPQNQDIE